MRLPRMRFTVREMMVAVVVLAGVLGILAERRVRFRRIADRHAEYARRIESQHPGYWIIPDDETPYGYSKLMAAKYSYAADHPWLPVEPDPPEPK